MWEFEVFPRNAASNIIKLLTPMNVKDTIISAFSEVKLGHGKSIRQIVDADNRVEDGLSGFSNFKDFENWQDIPDEQIEMVGTHGVFSHGGAESTVFHLPATMLYILKYYEGFFDSPSEVELVHGFTIICLEKNETIELLNELQKSAVKVFLGTLIDKSFKTDDEEVLFAKL